jgi:hypothetical protein
VRRGAVGTDCDVDCDVTGPATVFDGVLPLPTLIDATSATHWSDGS